MKLGLVFLKRLYSSSIVWYQDKINFVKYLRAKIFSKKIVYSKFSRINNFGDLFNKDLIRFFGAELIYTSSYKKSRMVLTGSILGDYHREYTGYILGAGFISKRYNRFDNHWKIKILRGPLSAKQCGIVKGVVYGDPGILASQIYPFQREVKYELGVIPHKRDWMMVNNLKWDKTVKIIDPRQLPSKVVKQMNLCRHIASSSLHGLIFADSFQIPSIHLKFSDNVIGGFHKFDDYYLGMQIEPEHLNFTSNLTVIDIMDRCKLRYTADFLFERQEEIKKIIHSVIHKD